MQCLPVIEVYKWLDRQLYPSDNPKYFSIGLIGVTPYNIFGCNRPHKRAGPFATFDTIEHAIAFYPLDSSTKLFKNTRTLFKVKAIPSCWHCLWTNPASGVNVCRTLRNASPGTILVDAMWGFELVEEMEE